QRVEIQGVSVWIASAEDVIVTKLEWAKRTGSERQLRDVAGILPAKHENLDHVYIQRWVQELRLAEQWNAATSE
ncbi:MAG: hypothetical protein ACI9MC_003023, partial [Kiritimatiellia bacterium]